jgi:hypothetical protein
MIATGFTQLENQRGSSACDTDNGGCTITLSDDFVMGSILYVISFSGKTIAIWGQGKVLTGAGEGRFIYGYGADSFLELHDVVLENWYSSDTGGAIRVDNEGTVEIYDVTLRFNAVGLGYSDDGQGSSLCRKRRQCGDP